MSSSISSAHADGAKPSGVQNSELVQTPNQLRQGEDPGKREVGAETIFGWYDKVI